VYAANDAIDIWVVERALGHGGMGSVYRCHNRDARRILAAIKVLDYGLQRSSKARARFVREAEILFSLDHPHIVKVRNVRLDADPPYLEMEFVEGGSLERRILAGPVAPEDVVRWLGQLASALAYLHARGIRHRDVEPSNVLVNLQGNATLVDFGIATEADGNTITESGQAMGSVAYVPPEWVQMGRQDPVLWDIYALGVCAWEALTGRTAFGVPSGGMSTQRFYQVLTAKQGHPPLAPGPDVPIGLRELVRAMTDSDPRTRIASADEVLRRVGLIDTRDVRPAHEFDTAAPAGGQPASADRSATMVPGTTSWEAAEGAAGASSAASAAPAAPAAPAPARRRSGVPLVLAAVGAAAGAALLAPAVGARAGGLARAAPPGPRRPGGEPRAGPGGGGSRDRRDAPPRRPGPPSPTNSSAPGSPPTPSGNERPPWPPVGPTTRTCAAGRGLHRRPGRRAPPLWG
jgi:predicted Ser/Thr protein kinase